MTGAGGALPDWDAADAGGGWAGRVKAGAGADWASAGAEGVTVLQAGAGAGEGGAARALGPGREAGLRASEAWEEPLSAAAAGGTRPEPGRGRWSGSGAGTEAGRRVGTGGAEAVRGGWAAGTGPP